MPSRPEAARAALAGFSGAGRADGIDEAKSSGRGPRRESGGDRFAAVVFFTYLYYPTYWGLKAVPERSALVPTTHDEPPLRFSVYRELFSLPRAFGFLTPAEEALVRRRFALGDRPGGLAGMGAEVPAAPDVDGFRARHGLERPYAIYAGRITRARAAPRCWLITSDNGTTMATAST